MSLDLGGVFISRGEQVHAYGLMSNHYHLVLETPHANLVAGMAWLQSTYTIRLNNRHKLCGHVLSGRYQAQLVEGSGNGYLRRAWDYEQMEGKLGDNHPGELNRESGQAKADRIIQEGLSGLGWNRNDLLVRRKSDPAKLALAARLRKETTLAIKEIADHLHLGKPKGAKSNLHKWMRQAAHKAGARKSFRP